MLLNLIPSWTRQTLQVPSSLTPLWFITWDDYYMGWLLLLDFRGFIFLQHKNWTNQDLHLSGGLVSWWYLPHCLETLYFYRLKYSMVYPVQYLALTLWKPHWNCMETSPHSRSGVGNIWPGTRSCLCSPYIWPAELEGFVSACTHAKTG